jgi:hypothetical protein
VDLLLASSLGPASRNGKSPDESLQQLGSVIAERQPKDLAGIAKRFIQAVAQHRDWSRQAAKAVVPVPA